MGTWDATPSGNDTAMDWLAELTTRTDARAWFASALSRAGTSDGADAPQAEEAIVAAAVIAAAASEPIGAIGADTRRWIATTGFTPDPDLLDAALRAVAAVRGRSELRDLWEASGKLGAWLGEVDQLAERLRRARDAGLPARSPRAPATPRSLHRMVALFASHPDPALRKKILAKVAALEDPNAPIADTDFQAPLTLMARHGLLEESRQLLARGADPRHGSSQAFREACVAGCLDVARALHAAGATLFHEHRVSPASGLAVQVAIEDPTEPVAGHRYCLALFAVARAGSPEAADYLRGLGASLGQTDLNGETLLHKAAGSGRMPMLRYLLDEGLDPNRAKGSGESPLHYAARAGRVEAVRVLLEGGADPNAVDRFDGEEHQWRETPLDVAESPEVRDLLTAHGARSADVAITGGH